MAKKKGAIDDAPQLPGTEDERDEQLIRAAKRYRKEMLARKAANEEETAAHEALVRIMHEKGITSYKYKDLSINLDVTEKAKVKVTTEPSENGTGEE